MISISTHEVDPVIKSFRPKIKKFVSESKRKLLEYRTNEMASFNPSELAYLDQLIIQIRQLVTSKPKDLLDYKTSFGPVPYRIVHYVKNGQPKQKKDLTFRNKIRECLRYEDLRSEILPELFSKIGIKACVYCNSALCVSIIDKSGNHRAKFQADHFIPSSTYPCFSVSLYNLFPVCGSCNIVKSDREIDFQLYLESSVTITNSKYKFEIDKKSILNYLLSRKDSEKLIIRFIEPPLSGTGVNYMNEIFDIQGIYDTQKDLAEELIIKARIYNKPYKNALKIAFPKLFNNVSLSNRVLIGNYMESENIHKRPMAKFTQDIAKQLGLI